MSPLPTDGFRQLFDFDDTFGMETLFPIHFSSLSLLKNGLDWDFFAFWGYSLLFGLLWEYGVIWSVQSTEYATFGMDALGFDVF